MKRQRADNIWADEKLKRESKQKEIKELKKQLESMENKGQKIENKVHSLKKYEDFLDTLIKLHSDQYADLQDIHNRYQTLSESRDTLQAEHKKITKDLEDLKFQSALLIKEKNHEILQFNNEIKQLQQTLELKKNELFALQSDVDQSNNSNSEQNLDIGRILMAIDNLQNRCTQAWAQIQIDAEEEEQQQLGGGTFKAAENKDKKAKEDKQKGGKPQDKDQDLLEQKNKQAGQNLDQILNLMKAFKDIQQECQQEKEQQRELQKLEKMM